MRYINPSPPKVAQLGLQTMLPLTPVGYCFVRSLQQPLGISHLEAGFVLRCFQHFIQIRTTDNLSLYCLTLEIGCPSRRITLRMNRKNIRSVRGIRNWRQSGRLEGAFAVCGSVPGMLCRFGFANETFWLFVPGCGKAWLFGNDRGCALRSISPCLNRYSVFLQRADITH